MGRWARQGRTIDVEDSRRLRLNRVAGSDVLWPNVAFLTVLTRILGAYDYRCYDHHYFRGQRRDTCSVDLHRGQKRRSPRFIKRTLEIALPAAEDRCRIGNQTSGDHYYRPKNQQCGGHSLAGLGVDFLETARADENPLF